MVVGPSRWRSFQRISTRGSPLLEVVKPKSQGSTVFQRGGRVDESIGQELAGLLQVMTMLNGMGQDTWQQAHVLALGFSVARFEQWEMCED